MNTLNIIELSNSINNDEFIDINDIPFEFDTQLIYLFKSFTTLEGVCKHLHKDFNYIDFVYEIVFELVDMEMIMDKMAFDIQLSTSTKSKVNVTNQSYTKMAIERNVKRLESQNKNLLTFLLLSVLSTFFEWPIF